MASIPALKSMRPITRPGLTFYPGLVVTIALLFLTGAVFFATLTTGLEQETTLSFDGIGRLLAFTTAQATASTLFSLLLGVLLAWSLKHRHAFKGRRVLMALLSVSMVLPTIVTALGLISVLGRNGWVNQIYTLSQQFLCHFWHCRNFGRPHVAECTFCGTRTAAPT